MGRPIHEAVIFDHWGDVLRLTAAIKTRAVQPSAMSESWASTGNRTACASLTAGNHMYQPNSDAGAQRAEICTYANRLCGRALTPKRLSVTQSGTQALALAAQLLVSPGDRIAVFEPGWPNIAGTFKAADGTIASVALAPANGRWAVDFEALLAQLTPETRAVVLNSPNNPTGWTLPGDEKRAVLEHCRRQAFGS